jgi:hypothetical protein
MKNKALLYIATMILMYPTTINSNGHGGPPPHYFNELYFENDFWILELFTLDFENLDGWFLTTVNDTAYFIDGISPTEDYILITSGYGYLQTELSINKMGDWLSLYNQNNERVDEAIFGEMYNAQISAPLVGQSISVELIFDEFFIHYLDNSPTLGEPNDDADAYGTIEGNVLDAFGNPLSNLEVKYFGSTDYTDLNGYFSFYNIAVMEELQVVYNAMILDHYIVQTWPDSIVMVEIYIQEPLSSEENKSDFEYHLSQNFPNPFNPTTTLEYIIPEISIVTLKVYDVMGNEVATLVNEEKEKGYYKSYLDASELTSGIYFYQLKANNFIETKKMVLLK